MLGDGYGVLGIGSDSDRTLSLRYTDLIAPLVKAVQEQQAQIEDQRATIAALKARLTEIDELRRQVQMLLSTREAAKAVKLNGN